MSLNKSKAWPVENFEDVLKIDKKLMTTKRGSYDQFLTKLKFSDPNNVGMDSAGMDESEIFF